jgi:hypothetical protein
MLAISDEKKGRPLLPSIPNVTKWPMEQTSL